MKKRNIPLDDPSGLCVVSDGSCADLHRARQLQARAEAGLEAKEGKNKKVSDVKLLNDIAALAACGNVAERKEEGGQKKGKERRGKEITKKTSGKII